MGDRGEPFPEARAGLRRRVRAGDAEGAEAELLRFFFQAFAQRRLALVHPGSLPHEAGWRGKFVAGGLAIEAKGLFKAFDGKTAVEGIDLAVPEGSIYGILGPNGAGKTTILRMLLGIIDPDRGSRTLLGREEPLEAANLVGYLPEERGLYPSMKTREAVAFMGALRGLPLDVGRKRAEGLLRD